jgi:hypothetical protein
MASQLAINPAVHSLGLVKGLQVNAETSKIDLTQGITNEIVSTVVNAVNITGSCEVYEYTAKNLAYGLGLDGSGFQVIKDVFPLQSAVAAAATTCTVASDQTAKFPVGSWIFLQEGAGDQIHIARVASVSFSTNTTITFTGYPVPASMNFTTGGRVGVLNKIDADPTQSNNYFAVRVIGTAVNDKRPMILHFPKVRITRGFAMAFTSDNFSNLPFEFSPMAPTPADEGYSALFPQRMAVLVP